MWHLYNYCNYFKRYPLDDFKAEITEMNTTVKELDAQLKKAPSDAEKQYKAYVKVSIACNWIRIGFWQSYFIWIVAITYSTIVKYTNLRSIRCFIGEYKLFYNVIRDCTFAVQSFQYLIKTQSIINSFYFNFKTSKKHFAKSCFSVIVPVFVSNSFCGALV